MFFNVMSIADLLGFFACVLRFILPCPFGLRSLILAGLFSNPETVKMLNQNGMLDCSCLVSTQEEADTRIILHALYSDKLYQENNVQGRIVVKSPDTDVLSFKDIIFQI
jgi:hypothetical protein